MERYLTFGIKSDNFGPFNGLFRGQKATGMPENPNLYSPIYLLTKSSLGQMALSEVIGSLYGSTLCPNKFDLLDVTLACDDD